MKFSSRSTTDILNFSVRDEQKLSNYNMQQPSGSIELEGSGNDFDIEIKEEEIMHPFV
jgi:hypothetical protein